MTPPNSHGRRRPRLAIVVGLVVSLAVPPWQAARAADATVAPRIHEASAVSGADPWWTAFGDPMLDAIIDRMHANNTRIEQAAARLAAANARAHLGAASQTPTIGLGTSFSHASGPLINKAGDSGNLYGAGLAVAWEVDVLGRLSGDRAAERLDAKAAAAMLADTRLLLEAATVRQYFESRALQLELVEAEATAALSQEQDSIAEARVQRGTLAPADMFAIHQHAITSAKDAAELERRLTASRNALAFLIGDGHATALPAAALPVPPDVPSGLPSDMLARRPDIAAALDHLHAATNRLESAKRSWLPAFSLTTSGGVVAPTVGELLAASARSFGIDLLFALPLFDGGRHAARVAGGKAELDLARAEYREAMLAALRDVNDALAAVQSAATQSQLTNESLNLHERDAALAEGQSQRGSASRSNVIDRQLAVSRQRRAALAAQFNRIAAAIDLTKAVGGGWTRAPGP